MSRLNILITGASKGIGKAIAFALDEKDNNLFLFGRDEEKLNNLSSEINCNSEIFAGDVSDTKFVNESVSEIIAKYNKIDVLVNNAGVA
ncbi:MAG: SDR family NAD(P)-dependent oxidoreductase, partial [Ignavibacteria bacterium]